ncbi:MAG: hypothetical protein ACREMX_05055 [Gemmatimonadales bacterium]
MLITFSGLDGSGKSTLIRSLRAALEASNTAVVVCHMNHDIGIFAAVQALRNRLIGSAPSPGHARAGNSRWQRLRHAVIWNKPCRRVLYLADLLVFVVFRFRVERRRDSVLLMDRYFYDTLVDVAGPRGWTWARLLARITPTPHLAVLLDATPEVAFARKGEFSVEYLARRSLAYKRVFGWVRSTLILDAADLDGSTRELARLVTGGDRR